MDQTICSSSRPREEPDVCHDNTHRNDERRAAMEQMMAENREGLGMKVIAVMVQRYGVLPMELWDLNSNSDMGAGRGMTYGVNVSKTKFKRIISNSRYSIVNLIIGTDVAHSVDLPGALRKLEILAKEYNYQLDLPATLQELIFDSECKYNRPLTFPDHLQKLVLGNRYNLPITPPSGLVELDIGTNYSHPLHLPQRLKRLAFEWDSKFNLPLSLPAGLTCFRFGEFYNQPTTLPAGIEELKVERGFTHDISFPSTMRKINWYNDRPVQLPEGLAKVKFYGRFDHPVVFPSSLTKVCFLGHVYSHPLTFPDGLEKLDWGPRDYAYDVLLPERLQKLTWWSSRSVDLPLGLRELGIRGAAPLVLLDGLLKVTFGYSIGDHYDLPESVQEVVLSNPASVNSFTHRTTLRHLIVKDSIIDNVDMSHHKINKLTIEDPYITIKRWPQGLKELEFTVKDLVYPLQVPKGCYIVGEKRPGNVIIG